MPPEFNEGGDNSQIPNGTMEEKTNYTKNKESCYMTWFVSGLES